MKKAKNSLRSVAGVLAAAAAILIGIGHAEARTVKVGILLPLTGAAAEFGERMKRGVDLAFSEIGGKIGDDTVDLVFRDTGDASLQRIRQLAQELAVRDKVDYMGGLDTTPAAISVADVATQAKIPFVVFNSGTAGVTRKSPYFVRSGFTQWVVTYPLGKWVAEQGRRRMAIIVADFAPGYDAAAAFTQGFKEAGGTILDTLKVPLGTTDPSSYVQKIQDIAPDGVFMFFNVGAFEVNFVKDYLAKGLRKRGIELFGTAELDDVNLRLAGPEAIGIVTSFFYDVDLDNEKNKSFIAALRKKFGPDMAPSSFHVQAYDGMQIIFHMIKTAHGGTNADAMASLKTFQWESPRGAVTVDPNSREIMQKIYLRRVVDAGGGRLVNRVFGDFGIVSLQPQ